MVKAGVDILLQQLPGWKHQRIGLVTNDAALTCQGLATRVILLQKGFNLVKIFSPEHGISAKGVDGAPTQDQIDLLTGLPVLSLYGEKLTPALLDVLDLEVLLFDIPDAGTRFYTYLWTLSYCLEVAALANIPLVVLDRPNPISGLLSLASGPFLQESTCSSFIGRWSIPIRHSCTLGELALYFNREKAIGCQLQVVRCAEWKRHHFFPDTHWNFTPPSPALQQFENLLFYPGTCLLEATNLHEGRGTDQAFTLVAAPWLHTSLLRQQLSIYGIEGVQSKESRFTSTTGRYAGEICNALIFSIEDREVFNPVFFGFLLVKCIKDHFLSFAWNVYPTAVNPTGQQHLDRLIGVPNSQQWFDLPFEEFRQVVKRQSATAAQWKKNISSELLYD